MINGKEKCPLDKVRHRVGVLTYQQLGRQVIGCSAIINPRDSYYRREGWRYQGSCPGAGGRGMQGVRSALLAAAFATAVGVPFAAAPARAQDTFQDQDNAPVATQASDQGGNAQSCPGNPNALGTSRVLAVDPAQYLRVGIMQYPNSLPLADHEVVLTFDDGPLPPYSNQVLDILATECVKATYFLVGEMARTYPAVVRREYEEGHTIGTHSEDHPMHFGILPVERMRFEIDAGISDVGAAMGDPKYLAPFFRIPGLDRSDILESELAARSLTVFSSDTLADDWHRGITPAQITTLALSRLERLGKGILLLHDIHPKTVAALPGILKGLKDRGFHIVQVVPAPSYVIAMAKKPQTRMLASATPEQITIGHGIDDNGAQPSWPETSASVSADDTVLPVPDPVAFEPDSGTADNSADIKWPAQPETIIASPESRPANGKRFARGHKPEVTGSLDHGRHHIELRARPPARARAGSEGRRADVSSKTKSVAALYSRSETAH
jgi:peptidoglycan/xylan/chitin deacetylase (PgdA/CDA1 family)